MKKLTDLQAILRASQSQASGNFNSSISSERARLMDRYNAEAYGDEIDDRSTYLDTTARDTTEAVKPELLDIFMGGDRVVEFTPRGREDVEQAQQETDVVNHIVMELNEGYKTTLDWFHDALTQRTGYVKRYWEERLDPEIEEYADMTHDEWVMVLTQADERGDIEIVESDVNEDGRFDFKIKITPREGHHYRIEAVPPEEIVVHPEWTKLEFDDCPYVAHRRAVPVSDLVAMGFNRKQVEGLPSFDPKLDSQERNSRFSNDRSSETDYTDSAEASMRTVLVHENYIRIDRDEDGIAELLQIWTGGEQAEILKRGNKPAIEEVDAAPFNVLSPYPIPHKHYGLSVVDMMDDLQRVRTVLIRQMLDNMVQNNYADTVLDQNQMTAETVEDVQVTAPGRVIRIPGGMASMGTLPPTDMVSGSLAALEFVRSEGEQRVGVTRLGQGIDKDALNKTFGGQKALINQAQKKILLIARTFAETGFKRLFVDVHRDLRKGPMRKIAVRLRNQWVEVDPRTWKTRADMSVNVGLGTGDRDIQFERLGMILTKQEQGMAAGLVEPRHIHHTLSKMLEMSGFKDVEAFFPEPPPGPLQQEQGESPEAMLAQVEMQKTQAKTQTDMAKIQSDGEIKREQAAVDAQIAAEKLLLESRKSETDAEIEKAKLEIEAAKLQLEREKAGLEARKVELQALQADASIRTGDHAIRSDLERYEINRDEILGHVGASIGPAFDEMRAEGASAQQRIEQLNAALSETYEASKAELSEIARALSAPKQIVFDEDGRPSGVKTNYKGGAEGPAGEIVDMITKEKRLVRDADGRPAGVE